MDVTTGGRSNRRLAVARGAGAVATGVGLAGGGVRSAAAHHSYPATYDTAQRVTVSGLVQLVRFTNPHVHVVLEELVLAPAASPPAQEAVQAPAGAETPAGVGTADGGEPGAAALTDAATEAAGVQEGAPAAPAAAPEVLSTLWVLDLPSPGQAERIGLTLDSLPAGTPLTVEAWPSRSAGSHDLAPLTLTFSEKGRTIRIR